MDDKRFCPNCGSSNVEPYDGGVTRLDLAGDNFQNTWKCQECGYSGYLPEGKPQERNFEKKEYTEDAHFPQAARINRIDIIPVAALALVALYMALKNIF
ncbi:MAG: hypothetical protein ABEJ03_03155 [Candidatus Nanohaloarchaea archaeon]